MLYRGISVLMSIAVLPSADARKSSSSDTPGMYDLKESKHPGAVDSASRGHGTGFRAQRLRKSKAYFDGRIMRFAWIEPGARPAVGDVKPPEREVRRTERPVGCSIAFPLLSARTQEPPCDACAAPRYKSVTVCVNLPVAIRSIADFTSRNLRKRLLCK